MAEAFSAESGQAGQIPAQPSISIAMPTDVETTDSPELARWQTLSEILWEKQIEFFESQDTMEFGTVE
jgi:hypothetical protein